MKIFQQKILWLLFISALILLTFNLLLEFNRKSTTDDKFPSTSGNLQIRFESVLRSFGLKDDWIKKKTVKDTKSERKYTSYQITLPVDLTIPEVLLEIYKEFREDSLTIESNEKLAGGRSVLTLIENSLTLLSAELKYGTNFKRERGSLVFVIRNIELNNIEDSLLVESANRFNMIITPSEESLNLLPFIRKNRKSFSVIISDEIKEAKYKLDASYSFVRISNVVKALSVDYAGASFFVIDDNFEFYGSEKFRFFSNELEKRNIKLYRLSDFILLEGAKNISDKFNKLLKELNKGDIKVLVLSKKDYLQLEPDIALYVKTGVKILHTSEIKR